MRSQTPNTEENLTQETYGNLTALVQICRISASKEQAERIIGKHNADKLPIVRQLAEYRRLPEK